MSTIHRITAVAATAVAVLALAGPATASLNGRPLPLPPNTVGSSQVKDGSIEPRDLSEQTKRSVGAPRLNSVGGWQIKNGTLTLDDLSPSLRRMILQGCAAK